MKRWTLLVQLLMLASLVHAQGEQNTWFFGSIPTAGTSYGFNFNSGIPTMFDLSISTPPLSNVSANNCISDANGQILFYTNGRMMFDRLGRVMPNGSSILYSNPGLTISAAPVIVLQPGSNSRYYQFQLYDGGLYYNIVDMAANNGYGDVVYGKKNIPLNGFDGTSGIFLNNRIVAVQGCGTVWIVVRCKNVNQYRAYELTDTGVVVQPVTSTCGLLPANYYVGGAYLGHTAASPDGNKIVSACGFATTASLMSKTTEGALEMYDFDPFSGILSNPTIVDTGVFYYGACFSPDNSKLYASASFERNVYQFDLTASAVRNSKTWILNNPSFNTTSPDAYMLGDLRRGPDGKIYVGNNVSYNSIGNNAFHVIDQPNLPGMACTPIQNGAPTLLGNGYAQTWIDLPPDFVRAPRQDTIKRSDLRYACFVDSLQINADTGKNFRWSTGATGRANVVHESGRYYVSYTAPDCAYHIDTFNIVLVKSAPTLGPEGYACPGIATGTLNIKVTKQDNNIFRYVWKSFDGSTISEQEGTKGSQINHLDTGRYFVTAQAGPCDTSYTMRIIPLPVPTARFTFSDTICKGMPTSFVSSTPYLANLWSFGDGENSDEAAPQHIYTKPGTQQVALVVYGVEGCSDTIQETITIQELQLAVAPNKTSYNKGEAIWLETNSEQQYNILSWSPNKYFKDSLSKTQTIVADTETNISVVGISTAGCIDTAATKIMVNPYIWLPDAFTPNNDGKNDGFYPLIIGTGVKIITFRIYDRWGKCVWDDTDNRWYGQANGTNCQSGTYFYLLKVGTPENGTQQLSGSVDLIR